MKTRSFVLACAAAGAWFALPAGAQLTTWTGAGANGLWGDPANWSAGVPTAASEVLVSGAGTLISLGGVVREATSVVVQGQGLTLADGTLRVSRLTGPSGNSARVLAVLDTPGAVLNLEGGSIPVSTLLIDGGIAPGPAAVVARQISLRSPAQHVGETVAVALILTNAASLAGTSAIAIAGTFEVQATTPTPDYIRDGAPVELFGATFTLSGTTEPVPAAPERIGDLTFRGPGAVVRLVPRSPALPVGLHANSIDRRDARTGMVDINPAAGTRFTLATLPPLVGGGTLASQRAIVPWLFGGSAQVPLPITYDSGPDPAPGSDDLGLRTLNRISEFGATFSGAAPLDNVAPAQPQVIATPQTINALLLDTTAALPLTVNGRLGLESGQWILSAPVSGSAAVTAVGGTGVIAVPGEAVIYAAGLNGSGGYVIDVPIEAASLARTGPGVIRLNRPSTALAATFDSGTTIAGHRQAFGTGPLSIGPATIGFNVGLMEHTEAVRFLPVLQRTYPGGIALSESQMVAFDVSGGSTVSFGGPIEGAASIRKFGNGMLRLDSDWRDPAANISVSQGLLELNGALGDGVSGTFGSLTGVGIRGNGSVARNLGGEVSPGPNLGAGRLTAWRLLATGLTGPQSYRLTFDPLGDEAGATYDQFAVHDLVNLGVTIRAYELVLNLGFQPAIGTSFRLIDNRGTLPIDGRFLGVADTAVLTVAGVPLRVSYFGGDGNDFVATVIPEPVGLWLGAAAVAWLARRRRT